MKVKKLYGSFPFFERSDALTIIRGQEFETIDCSFETPLGQRIEQSVKIEVTKEDWPMKLTACSNYGGDECVNIFLDDDTMLAINEAYLRLRGHYSGEANG